jgi:periplasmic divalent cation tolerance protein
MTDKIVVLSTCGSAEEARKLARALVESRLAACVNIVPAIESVYRWQGTVEAAEEVWLAIKTSRSLFDQVSAKIRELHSYELPEVIALAVEDGSPAYLNWLSESL